MLQIWLLCDFYFVVRVKNTDVWFSRSICAHKKVVTKFATFVHVVCDTVYKIL